MIRNIELNTITSPTQTITSQTSGISNNLSEFLTINDIHDNLSSVQKRDSLPSEHNARITGSSQIYLNNDLNSFPQLSHSNDLRVDNSPNSINFNSNFSSYTTPMDLSCVSVDTSNITINTNQLIIESELPVVDNDILPPQPSSNLFLSGFRVKHLNRVIFAHININSIRHKFDMLVDIIKGNIDILLISETKIDDTFLTPQFMIPGFSTPFRLNRTGNGGGLLLYVREDIPSKGVHTNLSENLECLFVEINLYKKKFLIVGTYNPCRTIIANHLNVLRKCIDHFLLDYDNFVIMGDFNSEPIDNEIKEFCNLFNFKNLVKDPTCYKNPENPSCIDLIFTNRYRMFQDTITVEIGLSDCHKMTVTVLKTYFKKCKPNIISYRDYKYFSNFHFRTELEQTLYSHYSMYEISNEEFSDIAMHILEKHAPLKYKYIRANQSPFMNKKLRKAVMLRSQLRNKINKEKTNSSKEAFNKQRNICTNLLRKAKFDYYSNLNPSNVSDNKKFWNTVKPLFSEKVMSNENITLVENNNIYGDDKRVSEIFNEFFSNAVKNLNIMQNRDLLNENIYELDPINRAIIRYMRHPSILKIKECFANPDAFSFSECTFESVYKEICLLNSAKACPKTTIPTKIIKENCDIFALKLYIDFNHSIGNSTFPENLKQADISPIHKKGDRTDKSNYRPVSILSPFSKIYERLLFYQVNYFMDTKLSKHMCGFRKGYSAQHCLLVMLEKWRTSLDKKGCSGVLLTDLSKAFDCLSHDLLIAKLAAYGFDYNSIKLLYSYLTNRHQRVRLNSNYSTWSEIITGVPQGSILGPLLFNIYLSDLFLFTQDSDIANYADDNSPYACNTDYISVITQLEKDSKTLLEWVSNNALKANPDKFHLLLSTSDLNLSVKVDQFEIKNSNYEKLLGITIDNKLSFNEHVSSLCKKASQKLHALARVSCYMNLEKRRTIMKAFITSQFGYCPLVWMFHSRNLSNRINKIHERALRIVYDDEHSSFNELLTRDGSVTIHERNIQALAIELFKVINGISPEIMNDVFPLKESYDYCSKFPFKTRNIRTVAYGTETLSFMGPKIWSLVPNELKEIKTLTEFKRKIKLWKVENCPCRICKTYVAGLGFVHVAEDNGT